MDAKEFCEFCDYKENFSVCKTPEPRERYAKREKCGWSIIEGISVTTLSDFIKVNDIKISRKDKIRLKAEIDSVKTGEESIGFNPPEIPRDLFVFHNKIDQLVNLIRERNEINKKILSNIGLPILIDYIDEYIMSFIFKIHITNSPSKYGLYGYFSEDFTGNLYQGKDKGKMVGDYKGKTVNLKWYTERPDKIENNPDYLPDFHLAIIGTSSKCYSMYDEIWYVEEIYLFNMKDVLKKKNIVENQFNSIDISKEYKKKNQLYPSPLKYQKLPETQEGALCKYFTNWDEIA